MRLKKAVMAVAAVAAILLAIIMQNVQNNETQAFESPGFVNASVALLPDHLVVFVNCTGIVMSIGQEQITSIIIGNNKVNFSRPLTHDLLLNILNATGARLEAVRITLLENGTFYSELVINNAGAIKIIDSRPSDAVAIAVRIDVPVLISEKLLQKAGRNVCPMTAPATVEALVSDEKMRL